MEDVVEPVAPVVRPMSGSRDGGKLPPLIHRWFVEYNPAYFASALCLLAGIYLLSDGLGKAEVRSGEMWLLLTVQLYELMLIGAAAFLYRVLGQRRPAVILAIAEMVYLFDPTFQTEVAAYLEGSGFASAMVWLVGFAVKLWALCWALRLWMSRSATLVAIAAAAMVAIVPHLLYLDLVDGQVIASAIAMLGFLLALALIWFRPALSSRDELDDWGRLVLLRASVAVLTVWSAQLVGHVGFWAVAHELDFGALGVVVPILLITAMTRREPHTWFGIAAVIAVGVLYPESASAAAAMAGLVLVAKGRRGVLALAPITSADDALDRHPYRSLEVGDEPVLLGLVAVEPRRFYVGAIACAYFSLWTLGWDGGGLPAHIVGLDLAATAILGWLLVRQRLVTSAIALAALHGHHMVEQRLVPDSGAEWGVVLVGAGFALLLVGLAISWRLRDRRVEETG